MLHRLIDRTPQRVQRDTLELELDDGRRVEVQRVRDPRARRLKLSVDERGARLTLPPLASLVSGDRFLHEHRSWLDAQLQHTGAYVSGQDFTLADVVLGLSAHRWQAAPMERPDLPAVQAYLQTLARRPGFAVHGPAAGP